MLALTVSINGKTIATVSTDGYDLLSVRAGGTRIDEDLADLEVAGGSYPEGRESTYLTWVSALPLQPGQVVTVRLLESAPTSHRGKTIAELFPDEQPSGATDFKPTSELFADIRGRPALRDKFSFRLETSRGTSFVGETVPDEHGFGFTVNWESFHPERARVSLHSYSLENLEHKGPMNNHVDERLHAGDWVRFELVA
jgi:hypothetical protein